MACHIHDSLICAVLCQIVFFQYLSRTSLDCLAGGLPCHLFSSHVSYIGPIWGGWCALPRTTSVFSHGCFCLRHFPISDPDVGHSVVVCDVERTSSILVYAAPCVFCSCLESDHVSAPHVIAGITQELYIWVFRQMASLFLKRSRWLAMPLVASRCTNYFPWRCSVTPGIYLTRFKNIAIQGTPLMAADKETIGLPRVRIYHYNYNPPSQFSVEKRVLSNIQSALFLQRREVLRSGYLPALKHTSRVPVEGKSSVCLICEKYRILFVIIFIISLGQILLSYIGNTSRTHARTHAPARTLAHTPPHTHHRRRIAIRWVCASQPWRPAPLVTIAGRWPLK